MVAARLAGRVDIFSQLDIALGAEDGQPPVAPGRQPVRSEPVDPDVAGGVGAAQQRLAEILQLRRARIAAVGHRGRDDLDIERAGEEQELLELVRGDVGQDAAIAGPLEEPVRPRLGVEAVRPEPDGVDHLADRPGLHQLARLHGRPGLEMLGVADRVDPAGLGLHPPHLGQLLQRGHARLVGEIVLAGLHHGDAERRPVGRDAGGGDQLDRRVVQDGARVGDALRLGVAGLERAGEVVLRRVEGDELAPGAEQRVDLPEDVVVIDADGGEADGHSGSRFSVSCRWWRRPRSEGAGRTGRTRTPAAGSGRTSRTARSSPTCRWNRRSS